MYKMEKLWLILVLALLGNEIVCQNRPSRPFVPQPSRVTTVPTPSISASASSIQDCIRACPVTSEYNPVCGSNSVTYDNPGRLGCAQACGVSVTLLRTSRCPPPTPPPSV